MSTKGPACQRLLIVLLGSIGDVTRGLAVAHQLRRHRTCEITWLVEPKSADIVRMCPDVDRVIVFERKRGVLGSFAALLSVIRELRRYQFDVVLDLQRHAKSGFFSRITGAPRRIGFHKKNTKELNHWFNNEFAREWIVDETQATRQSKLWAYLSFLERLSIPMPERAEWTLDERRVDPSLPSPEERARGAAAGTIGLVLGSSWPSKNWMGNEQLIRVLLAQTPRPLLLIGDTQSLEQSEHLVAIDQQRITSTVGKSSLAVLVSVLRGCSVVVGPDSGPGHLCAALRVPFIGLFGPTDPRLTAPEGNEHLSIAMQLGCAPCYRRVCPGLGQLCLRLITPSVVMERLNALGADTGAPKRQ